MIETFGAEAEKLVEKTGEKSTNFFEKLESAVEVAKPEVEKKAEAIKAFWESLDSFDESDNETEQVEKLREEYIDDLKANSEYPDTIQDYGETYEKISPEENAKKREEFNDTNPENENRKEALIKKWEETNGKEWPRYEKDVYNHNGKLIRKSGDRYDAHHIHPLSLGGKNETSNITPISAEKHYDKQGVHAPDSPYGKLEKILQEDKKHETV